MDGTLDPHDPRLPQAWEILRAQHDLIAPLSPDSNRLAFADTEFLPETTNLDALGEMSNEFFPAEYFPVILLIDDIDEVDDGSGFEDISHLIHKDDKDDKPNYNKYGNYSNYGKHATELYNFESFWEQ